MRVNDNQMVFDEAQKSTVFVMVGYKIKTIFFAKTESGRITNSDHCLDFQNSFFGLFVCAPQSISNIERTHWMIWSEQSDTGELGGRTCGCARVRGPKFCLGCWLRHSVNGHCWLHAQRCRRRLFRRTSQSLLFTLFFV